MSNAKITVNKEVSVTAVYFRGHGNLKSFPKRMEYAGQEYTFLESGLRSLVRKGQRLTQIFNMTDGVANYRLKFDNEAQLWTLLDIAEQPRAFA